MFLTSTSDSWEAKLGVIRAVSVNEIVPRDAERAKADEIQSLKGFA